MKKLLLIALMTVCVLSQKSIGQQTIDLSQLSVDEGVTGKEKEILIDLIKESFNKYLLVSRFLSSNDADQYTNYFANNVYTFNDLGVIDLDEIIHPIDYVDAAIDNFPEGIDFEISNVKLLKLGIDESYDNMAIVSFKKKLEIGVNGENIETKQKITFTINPSIESVVISKLIGEIVLSDIVAISIDNKNGNDFNEETVLQPKKEVETPIENIKEEPITIEDSEDEISLVDENELEEERSIDKTSFNTRERFLSLTGGIGLGSLSLNGSIDNYPFDSELLKSTFKSIPVLNIQYGSSLDNRRKLFWHVAAQYELSKIETDISSFRHNAESLGIAISGTQVNSAQSNTNDVIDINIPEKANIRILKDLGGEIQNGKEVIELSMLHLMGGVSYKLYRSANNLSYLFTHLSLGASIIQPRGTKNISYEGQIVNGVKIPTSELFPILEVANNEYAAIKENGNLLEAYKTDLGSNLNSNLSSSTQSTTSFFARLGASYYYKLNYDLGIAANVNYVRSISSLYSNRIGASKFLEEDITSWDSSIIEHYHDSNSLSKFEFGIGVFLWFN